MTDITKRVILACSIPIFIFLMIWATFPHLHKWHIEQEVRKGTCCGPSEVVTYVWHYGSIVKSWYDPITTLDDSTKIKRRIEAQTLINNLKK